MDALHAAVRHLATRLALDLATVGRGDASLVVMVGPGGVPEDRVVVGPGLPAEADGIAGLVLPSDPIVVDAGKVHDPGVRELAGRWKTERLLVVPSTFGADMVAIGVVPLAAGAQPDRRTAGALAERFAAAVLRDRLLVGCA
jgi:hypothetical protein